MHNVTIKRRHRTNSRRMARPDPTPLDLTRLHLTRPTSLDSTRIHSTRPNPARLHSTRRVAVHAVRAGGDAPRPTASVPGISEQLAEDRRVVAFGVVGRRRLGPPPRGRAERRRNLRPPAAAAALRRLEMRRVGRARRTPGGALGISFRGGPARRRGSRWPAETASSSLPRPVFTS